MVVWVYAGGGYAEASSIVPLLQQHFTGASFQRRTPAFRKPGPRPDVTASTERVARRFAGNTGKDLLNEIKGDLTRFWQTNGPADLILVLDDSDCDPDPDGRLGIFEQTVRDGLNDAGCAVENHPPIIPALAIPELETWLLGDWEQTFAREFPNCHRRLQQALSAKGLRTADPESFNCRPEGGEYIKLSEDVLLPALAQECEVRFSKATDTPKLLLRIRPEEVKKRCPYFRKYWVSLENYCRINKK
ncbi:DUF4276 family protein [Armatimonas sp.]|uniref:DUF4276 family protein n=1 Tax=Armatimonas sp. TaxID=1872638 RepID=UPI003751EB05